MKQIYPDYYDSFRCIAGACRHSCCIGWEIDIDDETLALYNSVPGEFGQRLARGIRTDGETACFRLGEDERCPFLNADGLCDIILELGENAISEICTDHPRFRSFFSDRTETGIGLCCEASGRLILGREEPMRLLSFEDDEPAEPLTVFEEEILRYREHLIAVAQNRKITVSERLKAILHDTDISLPELSCRDRVDFYLSLERLDPAWDDVLLPLNDYAAPPVLPEGMLSTALEQLTVSFLYRHLPNAVNPDDLRALAAFCVHAVEWIRTLCADRYVRTGSCTLDDLVEYARLYSSEIEYSDENIAAIIEMLTAE